MSSFGDVARASPSSSAAAAAVVVVVVVVVVFLEYSVAVPQLNFCLGLFAYGTMECLKDDDGAGTGGCEWVFTAGFGLSLSNILANALSCGACVTGSSS